MAGSNRQNQRAHDAMNASVFDKLCGLDDSGFTVSDYDDEPLTAVDLFRRIRTVATILLETRCRSAALYADNGVDWIVSDFACQLAGVRVVPLPLFFSVKQLQFAIQNSGVDAVLTDRENQLMPLLRQCGHFEVIAAGGHIKVFSVEENPLAKIPARTSKITFTSGTTGRPKGVCLSAAQQLKVAESLVTAVGIDHPKHLCLLPLSTLLENVAGVYAPLLAGGQVIAPSLARLGLNGSSRMNIDRLLQSISHYQPDSMILVPEMLHALTDATTRGWAPPASLKFIAIGGGKSAASLLHSAADAGLPVHEGYGLSECASVVSLNRPGSNAVGSVGRRLDHTQIHIEDGEIVVEGSTFLGYAGRPDSWYQESVRTGDLGHVDSDGQLHIDGRKKNLLISSFGRNISPEWVESELLSGSLLQQAVVFGDAQAYCGALVSPRSATATDRQIDSWIDKVNESLPDYARVAVWHRLGEPLSGANGLMTDNGRPIRDQVAKRFNRTLTEMFDKPREALAV